MLVIYREDIIGDIVKIIKGMETNNPIKIYVFSPSQDPWENSFAEVKDKVELCALPQAILNIYRSILKGK
ncbi:MAG: hypothetical protein LUD48_04035 [Prevotella sp.]|nr:hypothetical protein [Prevotella sp.]